MTKYAEKLRDPRWQRMRLKVMERDGFACRECGDTRTTLNVHHKQYVRGRDPWEYSTDALETLCENCHTAHHAKEGRPAKPERRAPNVGLAAIVGLVGCCTYFILTDRRREFADALSPEMRALSALVGYFDGVPVPWWQDQWPGVRARFAKTEHAAVIEQAYARRIEFSDPREARAELEGALDLYAELKRRARALLRAGITSLSNATPEQRATAARILTELRA
jgi:hypothetical protein